MASLAIDHVAIPIFEAEKSYAFYAQTLGLPLLAAHVGDDWGGFPWLMMIFGLAEGRQLVLVALRGAEKPASALPADAHHVAFTLSSDAELATWKDKLARAAIPCSEEDHGGQRSLYFRDPNGLVLELTTAAEALAPDARAIETVRRFLAGERPV